MFGLFKAKPAPDVPVVFEFEMPIARSADELFGLLNYADPNNWKRKVGTVETVAPGRFRLALDVTPDHLFTVVVSEAEPGRLYAYDVQTTPRAGRIVASSERYSITPTSHDSCRVKLVTTVEFEKEMTRREWQDECKMLAIAVNNTLAKLKLHAEQGTSVIREIEAIQRAA